MTPSDIASLCVTFLKEEPAQGLLTIVAVFATTGLVAAGLKR